MLTRIDFVLTEPFCPCSNDTQDAWSIKAESEIPKTLPIETTVVQALTESKLLCKLTLVLSCQKCNTSLEIPYKELLASFKYKTPRPKPAPPKEEDLLKAFQSLEFGNFLPIDKFKDESK